MSFACGPSPYHYSGEDQRAKLRSRRASTLFQMARLGFETVGVSMCTRERLRESSDVKENRDWISSFQPE